MLPYAGYVDPESTLAIGVHHDGHLEATERTFCSLYHTFMFGFHPFAGVPSTVRPIPNRTSSGHSQFGKIYRFTEGRE